MKTIRKALRVLKLLSESAPEMSVSQVSRRLNIPKSTASRLLASLGEVGLLEVDPGTRRYVAGPVAGRLGALYRLRIDPHSLIRQKMFELARSTGHSSWMGVQSGRDVVVLYNVHGNHPVRYVIEPGSHLPAQSTAMGRALLSRLSDQEIRALYAAKPGTNAADRPSIPIAKLLRDLHLVRRRGWAEVWGDNFAGVGAVGCAISELSGQPIVGLSISYPISSISRRETQAIREELLASAEWLTSRLSSDSQG